MFATGHLSCSYLLCRLTGLSWPLLAAAAVFPDVIDKGLRLVGLFTTGRHVAHNLFAVIATTALVASWRGIRPGLSWLVGYIAHLLGDLPFSWDMQWFYPWNGDGGATPSKPHSWGSRWSRSPSTWE
jgi:membrane-bound metal-dependent hydrolase YbcI (DUF457 family)